MKSESKRNGYEIKSEKLTAIEFGEEFFIKLPEKSGWVCYMWGNKPGGPGMAYYPDKGQVPNAFVRFMMKVCFACTWVYEGTQAREMDMK
jgi:hypothetical protein